MRFGRCISLEVIHMYFKETLRMSADRANFRSAGADYNMTTVATIIVATDAFNLQGITRLCRRRQLRHRHT